MGNFKLTLVSMALTLSSSLSFAQSVTIDHGTQRFLGAVSNLDRGKYFVLHSNGGDADIRQFFRDYNVQGGRFFYGPLQDAKNKTGSVGSYPGTTSDGPTGVRNVNKGMVSTEHPRDAIRYNINLEAAADWAVEYYKNVGSDSGRPEIYEPMNEPFVHADDDVFRAQQPNTELMQRRMAQLFAEVGKKFDQTPELANMKIIGYSSAWPSLERFDFGHWNRYQKMFMDTAGAHMDGFSTHLYDGINLAGQDSLRSGSNSEAILDMIEAYSYIKWGVVKPHAITEYGGIERGYGDNYSDLANAQAIRSFNHLIFNLLEREDDVLVTIPFITDKSTWHLNSSNNYQPYGAVLLKPNNIGQPNPGGWEFTPRVLFYDLWKAAKGRRVDINSDNPDIQAQAFASANKLFVAVNNLDSRTQTFDLDFTRGLSGFQNVRVKSLKVFADRLPDFTNVVRDTSPTSLSLSSGETITLEYTFANSIIFDNAVRRTKYYANNYLQKIDSGVTQTYNYDGVDTGNGEASLRMSIGRKHNRSKQPIVRVNGTQVAVPTNWAGYDQSTRIDFFGTIEIPFDASLLNASNEVTVQFPDSGGHLASMILQMEKYDSEVVDNTPPPNPPSTNEQRPFSGAPINLPGRIEAEEFDFGGQDVAYNDADASNNGASVMREDEGVDIEARDGGVNVGWTADGEWLEYTVKPAASSYDISLRYATPYANRAISVQLGDDQLGVFQLPVTGSWGNFETITLPKVAIDSSDTEILRMTFQGGSTNVNWLEFAAANSTPMCIIK